MATAIRSFFTPKTKTTTTVHADKHNSAKLTIVHKKAGQAETIKAEMQEYIGLQERLADVNAKIMEAQNEQAKARELQAKAQKMQVQGQEMQAKARENQAKATQQCNNALKGMVTHLEGKSKILPNLNGGSALLPLVEKAVQDIKGLQARAAEGEDVSLSLDAAKPDLIKLNDQIMQLEKSQTVPR